jgi:hypothetical protein
MPWCRKTGLTLAVPGESSALFAGERLRAGQSLSGTGHLLTGS